MSSRIDCEDIERLLADFSAGNMGARTATKMRMHLDQCEACSAELRRIKSVMHLVEDAGTLEPPVGLWNGVYNQIVSKDRDAEPSLAPLQRLSRRLRLGIAAVAAIVVILVALISTPREPVPGTMPDRIAAEYVEGHAMGAENGLFADRFSLTSVAALAQVEQEKNGKL